MKTILALLFVAAVAAYTQAEELEYHPQAIMHYLEMEDREMANKVRTALKMPVNDADPEPGLPTKIPLKYKLCIILAIKCHKRAKEDACAHLNCIKKTGKCLKRAGLKIEDLPENMRKCLPIIPCCLLGSESCEEKLCCFVRYGECLKKLGDKEDAK